MKATRFLLPLILAIPFSTACFFAGFYCGAAREYRALISMSHYTRLWEYIRVTPALQATDNPKLKSRLAEGIESALHDSQASPSYSLKLLEFHLFNEPWWNTWKHNTLVSAGQTFSSVPDLPISVNARQIMVQHAHEPFLPNGTE